MYKFSKVDFLRWLAEMDDFTKQGKVNCYAEDAFNEISNEIVLHPLYFEEFCMEIDTTGDLERARRWLGNKTGKRGRFSYIEAEGVTPSVECLISPNSYETAQLPHQWNIH